MKDYLYRKVNIPNFENIQKELLDSIPVDRYNHGRTWAFDYSLAEMNSKCPNFMSWFLPRNKCAVRLFRFYVTKPGGKLKPHIDGGTPYVSPFGLNIPVLNCQNTKMFFYDCDKGNMLEGKPENYYVAILSKNEELLKVIDSIEIVTPHFVRNDIMHSVDNYNDAPRIMFTVRWPLHKTKYRTLDEVINTEGLFDS